MILSISEIDALKSSLDWWFVVEYVSTAIVFIGVVGEYIAEFTRFAESRQLVRPLGKISTLVLIVGLAGELVSLGRTHVISGQLTAFLEERVATAEERTKQLDKDLATARVEIEQTKERTEQEKLERIKIEEKLADRDLSPDQQDQLVNTLKKFAGRTVRIVIKYAAENEVAHIGDQIEEVFRRSGWLIRGSHVERAGTTVALQEYRGIMVGVEVGADLPVLIAAWAVTSSFVDERLAVQDLPILDAPVPFVPCVQVIVGRK
jgi:hypothetical protein